MKRSETKFPCFFFSSQCYSDVLPYEYGSTRVRVASFVSWKRVGMEFSPVHKPERENFHHVVAIHGSGVSPVSKSERRCKGAVNKSESLRSRELKLSI